MSGSHRTDQVDGQQNDRQAQEDFKIKDDGRQLAFRLVAAREKFRLKGYRR